MTAPSTPAPKTLDDLTSEDLEGVSDILKREILWRRTARPSQLPPENGEWFLWILRAGRGFGKTKTAAETVRWLAENGLIKNFIISGRTQSEAIKVQVKGPSGILACSPLAKYYPSTAEVRWPNGTVGHIISSEKPDAFRGASTDFVWCDEIASWAKAEECWDNIFYGLREGESPKILITTTPSLHPLLREIEEQWPDVHITTGSTYDNIDNLPENYVKVLRKKYESSTLAKQELYGEYMMKLEGAHWQQDWIQRREVNFDDIVYKRVCVYVDPALTTGKKSDYTGISIVGKRQDGTYDVIAIERHKIARKKWAAKAINYTKKWYAKLMIEDNMGKALLGDLVESIDPEQKYKLQTAIVKKEERIADAAFLYEKGLVYHVYQKGEDPEKKWKKVEQRMVTWRTVKQDGSPDDLDSESGALLYLARKDSKGTKIGVPSSTRKVFIPRVSKPRNYVSATRGTRRH